MTDKVREQILMKEKQIIIILALHLLFFLPTK